MLLWGLAGGHNIVMCITQCFVFYHVFLHFGYFHDRKQKIIVMDHLVSPFHFLCFWTVGGTAGVTHAVTWNNIQT